MKTQTLLFSILVILLIPTTASTATTERFEFRKAERGYLRLDKKTGIIAFCSRDNLRWQCKNVVDDDLLYKQKTQKPDAENNRHKQQIAQEIRPKTKDLPNGQELNKVLYMFKEMMRRFLKFARQAGMLLGDTL